MSRLALMIARFSLSAWVGAAALFVVNGISQVTHPAFDSVVRNHLVVLRFPAYYLFGFTLVSLGLLGILASGRELLRSRWIRIAAAALTATALAVMLIDYLAIYRPLEAMITPPDGARPAEFVSYHEASKLINLVHVGFVLVAALLICLPPRSGPAASANSV